MNRLKKLKNVVKKSGLADKVILVDALNRSIGTTKRQAQTRNMNTILAFGSKRIAGKLAQEDEFRMYARLALVLSGFIKTPSDDMTRLKAQFNTDKYGDVPFAKQQYESRKMIAWSTQYEHPLVIEDIDEISQGTNLANEQIQEYLFKAAYIARNVLSNVINALTRFDTQTSPHFHQWFGDFENKDIVLQNYKDMLARMNDHSRSITIKYTNGDEWGSTSKGATYINMGRNFFNVNKTAVSSDLACRYVVTPGKERWINNYSDFKAEETDLNKLYEWFKDERGKTVSVLLDEYADFAATLKVETRTKRAVFDYFENCLRTIGVVGGQDVAVAVNRISQRLGVIKNGITALASTDNPTSENEITAYGTLIHELSHMISDTSDHFVSKLGVPTNSLCYGPLICDLLATRASDTAISNADNYRLFAQCFGPRVVS